MAETNALIIILLVAIAGPAAFAFSASSWYCHRLVPRFITYSVTPCRYPCLVVSAHVHPHIIVQSEPDGTPCMTYNAFHHEGKIGKCRNNFCIQELSHKMLKRKKRFVCLYALARIIHLRKQRRKLEGELGQLRRQLISNRNRDVDNELARREESVTGGADGFGADNAGTDAGLDSGPETFPSAPGGAIHSGSDGMGDGGAMMRGVGTIGDGRHPSSGGGMGTAGVPRDMSYEGRPIGGGGDEASDTTQVRLRDGGDIGGSTNGGGGGSDAAYFG